MNKELIMALDALEKENGIDKEIMFAAIEKSLMDEYKAEFDKADNGRVELDRRTGDFHIYSDRTVVEEVIVPENRENKKEKYVSGTDIALEDARKIKPDCQLGDVITVEVKSEEFSRKAAKNAKNTIVQTIREQEKNALYNEYHSKEKELITGIVQRVADNGDLTIDLGRLQTVLKADDRFKDKKFAPGDRIKLYVVDVINREKGGPVVRVSRKSQELVKKLFEEEVTEIKDGVVEIMLLGQNVNSYGKNLDEPMSFAELLQEIEKIEGLERIRFMTSHPKDLSDELIEVMKNSKKICKHLHLPVQSGSTEILKKMNRRYTKEQYLDLVDRIRAKVPDISLTTDIIVGFPGETEEDFLETLDVVRRVRYDSAFTFQYSRRTGTPAAAMEDQIPADVVKDRFDRLLAEVQEISREVTARHLHTVQEVLVESINEQDASLVTGRMSNNTLVHFPGDASMIGTLQNVSLDECRGFYYMGTLV